MSRTLATFCLIFLILAAPTLQFLQPLTKRHLREKPFLALAFVGEKSTGKSSTLGRLLAELSPQPHFSQTLQDAESAGKGDSKYAWLVDTSQEEREAGETQTLHKVLLEGQAKRFVVKDVPGGLGKEALAAAATSNALVIFIDSSTFDDFESEKFGDYKVMLHGY